MPDLTAQDFAKLAQSVAANRDRDAFAVLFHHFAPRLNAYLQRLGLERGAAEDLAQDVLGVLWHKAHLFDPAKSSLSTWLFRVARNRRIDLIRRDRSALLDPNDPMLLPDEPELPGAGLDATRRDARIRAAISQLPEEQVTLIKAAFFTGLTHSQIAEETGLPLGTVKSRIRLAFQRLRKALESDAEVDTDLDD
jgi:RNA polymerase sigma-70 factor (ECF subfamily)